MPKDFEGEGADILRDDVSPAAKKRVSAGGLGQSDGGPGRRSERHQRFQRGEPDTRRVPGGADQIHDVIHHLLIDVQGRDRFTEREDVSRIQQATDRDLVAGAHPEQDFLLFVSRGIADPHLEHEPVELGLG
jgi:hypothetical protein